MPHRLDAQSWERYALLTEQSKPLLKALWQVDKDKYSFFQTEINNATTDKDIASLLTALAVYLKQRRQHANK